MSLYERIRQRSEITTHLRRKIPTAPPSIEEKVLSKLGPIALTSSTSSEVIWTLLGTRTVYRETDPEETGVIKAFTRFLLPACFVTALSLFMFVPSSHAASRVHTATNKSNSASILGTLKNELLAAINADRAAHGVASVTLSVKQSRCSTQHAAKMAAMGSLFHTNLATDVCSRHAIVGQNVGEDFGDAASAVQTLNSMMMNEGPCPHAGCPGAEFEAHGHYVNILSRSAHRVGIGIVIQNGTVWLAEDFTT